MSICSNNSYGAIHTMFYIYLLHSNFHVLSKDSNFNLYDPLNNFNDHNLSDTISGL
jgi:hypothetical protein